MFSEKAKQQMMLSQGYAVEIEIILRSIFKCDRLGFGGEVNSDLIRKHPFLSMTQGLAYIYATEEKKHECIDEFINYFSFYEDMSIDDLLSFDTKSRCLNNATVELQHNNGVEEIEYIISSFRKVIE